MIKLARMKNEEKAKEMCERAYTQISVIFFNNNHWSPFTGLELDQEGSTIQDMIEKHINKARSDGDIAEAEFVRISATPGAPENVIALYGMGFFSSYYSKYYAGAQTFKDILKVSKEIKKELNIDKDSNLVPAIMKLRKEISKDVVTFQMRLTTKKGDNYNDRTRN